MEKVKRRLRTGGRQKGTPNKATAAARTALALFMEQNGDRLQFWLDEIERKDGAQAAFKAYTSLLEFHVPKRQRVEMAEADQITVETVKYCWADGTPLTPFPRDSRDA
jgi:hypothetical protein